MKPKPRPQQGPLFANMMAAELFDAAHTRGPLKLLPRTDGAGYMVFDTRKRMGEGGIAGPFHSSAVAHAELERIWVETGKPEG